MAAQIDELGLDMNDVRLIFASLKNEEPWLWEEQHIEERLRTQNRGVSSYMHRHS